MLILFFIKFIYPLSESTRKALHAEDLRMARHLISEGITVTHPDFPFLKDEIPSTINKKHDIGELKKEDGRMMRHLALEGFTVN